MKILNYFQKLPKWAWVLVGGVAIVVPEVSNYLQSAIGYSPDFLAIVGKVSLWLVGFSPLKKAEANEVDSFNAN